MTINKKIIYPVVAVALVIVATIGTIVILNLINGQNTSKSKATVTISSVNNLRDRAETARGDNNIAKEKTLLLEAQQQVSKLPKTDETKATQVDINAQLWLSDHPTAQ